MRYQLIAFAAVWLTGVFGTCAQAQGVLDEITLTEPAGSDRAGEGLAVLDVTGILSMDHFRSPNNAVVFLWIGPFNVLNGIGWDVVLQTVAPGSLLSEMGMVITNTELLPVPNFGFRPAGLNNVPGGPTHFSRESFKFADIGLPNVQALADGLIRLEFADTPDNASGQPDGRWVSGAFTFQTLNPIPSPASVSMLSLFISLFSVNRRRKR